MGMNSTQTLIKSSSITLTGSLNFLKLSYICNKYQPSKPSYKAAPKNWNTWVTHLTIVWTLNWTKFDSTVPFRIVRPSRVTGTVDVAQIGCLSHVTERLAGRKASFGTFGALCGAQAPREMDENSGDVTGPCDCGWSQNFVQPVPGHTPGRTIQNGTVSVLSGPNKLVIWLFQQLLIFVYFITTRNQSQSNKQEQEICQ